MAVEQANAYVVETAAPARRQSAGWTRKWLAIGTGIGIEPVGDVLRVVVARVRPGGVEVVGYHRIDNYRERPASEWGTEFAAFARSAGAKGLPVCLLLPRSETIVRHVMLPGVGEKDLPAAVGYQLEGLHPYAEDAVAFTYARLGNSPAVLVGIARKETADYYSNLLSEAGIKMAGFSFSAAVLYSASRVLVKPSETPLAFHGASGATEVYGESPARPIYSALFEMAGERARRAAVSELRLETEPDPATVADLLPPFVAPESFPREEGALALAAAIWAACPRLALPANLLGETLRTQTARWIYVPTIVLSALLASAALVLAWQESYQDKLLVQRLQIEIRTLEKEAAKAQGLDKAAQGAQDRVALLDRYRQRPRADMEALKEVTTLVAAPAWLQGFQLSRNEVYLNGEGENAAGMLKLLDESPRFANSAFSTALARMGSGPMEVFAIKTSREGPGTGFEPGENR